MSALTTTPRLKTNDEIASWLYNEMNARWTRWDEHYGPLCGAWVGQPRSAQDRLALLVQRFLRNILSEFDGKLWCDLQDDDQGRPVGIMIARSFGTTSVIPLRLTERALVIGEEVIALGAPHAGDAICWEIAQAVALPLQELRPPM